MEPNRSIYIIDDIEIYDHNMQLFAIDEHTAIFLLEDDKNKQVSLKVSFAENEVPCISEQHMDSTSQCVLKFE